MQYVLGNMLNGGGGLNADGLSLDLQFAADKTLTARKGPTPTFTRASSGTFVGSDGLIQTAATNIPRFDHTSAGVCRGLLIEESRTNSLKFSENFTNTTNWSASNQTITMADVGPDGITNSAAVLNEGTSGGQHSVRGAFGQNRPVMGAVSCTLSAFFKAGTRRYILFAATDAGVNGVAITIDTQTWGVTDAKAIGTGFTYTTNRLTNYGGGWYRAELTFTPPAAATVTPVIWGTTLSTFTALDPTYTGNSSTIIAYGIQLEAGSFPTSYIPATTASVVRSADVCSITGAAFSGFYNATEGTSFVAAIRYANVGNPRSFAITNGTSGNRVEQVRGSTAEQIGYYAGGSFFHSLHLSAATVGVNYRIAHAMAANNFAASMNGASPVVNNSGVMITADRMIIGANFQGSTAFHNGTISAIRYYRKRLANQKLQALTA